ncbi:MAG TPA: copper chaperone PCu(A)C [Pseudomonadales bacterium]
MRPDARLLLAALLLSGCGASDVIDVDDARVRALIPSQETTAAYFTLHNERAEPVILVGAESDAARSIEMHTSRRDGEVVRMRRLPNIQIPAGGTVRFEPGGHHLMLFGVTSLGARCRIRLLFADGTAQTVTFERVAAGAS